MSVYHKPLRGRKWQAVRLQVFKRDGYRCRECGRPGRLEADHVQPLHKGGEPWNLANIQTLCRACHIHKTSGEQSIRANSDNAQYVAWERFLTRTVREWEIQKT